MPPEYRPQYTNVIDGIIQKIHDGVYRPGIKLPGIRQLAAEFMVGRQVVHYALTHLAERDYVYAEPKRGVFVNPKLIPGRFYRLALLISNSNPAAQGLLMHAVTTAAFSEDYNVVLFSNFRNGIPLAEQLKADSRFDGLLLTGEVDEKLLDSIRPFHIPYLVLGNYEIAPEHPQERLDLKQTLVDCLVPEFRPFAGKSIAALMGNPDHAADREAADGVREAIVRAGASPNPDLVVNTHGDGYIDCCRLFEEHSFDVLYIHGYARGGYRKYCELRNPLVRPYVICNIIQPVQGSRYDCIDRKITFKPTDYAARGTVRLLQMLEEEPIMQTPFRQDLSDRKPGLRKQAEKQCGVKP